MGIGRCQESHIFKQYWPKRGVVQINVQASEECGENKNPMPKKLNIWMEQKQLHGCQDLEKLVFPEFSRFSLIKIEIFP